MRLTQVPLAEEVLPRHRSVPALSATLNEGSPTEDGRRKNHRVGATIFPSPWVLLESRGLEKHSADISRRVSRCFSSAVKREIFMVF